MPRGGRCYYCSTGRGKDPTVQSYERSGLVGRTGGMGLQECRCVQQSVSVTRRGFINPPLMQRPMYEPEVQGSA